MAAVVAVPAAFYLLVKPKSDDSRDLVQVADLSHLTPDEPQEIVYTRTRVDGWREVKEKTTAWVVKSGKGGVVAFSPQCTHLGCAYHWEAADKKFVCPCHTSEFALDGKVLSGPAPRPLDRLVSKVKDGKLLIGSQVEQS
jgi:menaquinol-cytochrome c reductase iron-sulfur subunit